MTSLLFALHLQEEEPEYRITAERKARIEEFFLRKHTDEGFDLLKRTMSKRHSRKSSRPSRKPRIKRRTINRLTKVKSPPNRLRCRPLRPSRLCWSGKSLCPASRRPSDRRATYWFPIYN